MKISIYNPEINLPEGLAHLLRSNYGAEKNFDYFLDDYKKAYKYCQNSENISFIPISGFEGNKMVFHAALIIDKRLPQGEVFFGFFECGTKKQFDEGWKFLIQEAEKNQCRLIKGPVNGSIWHQYRCIKYSDKSDFFKSELPTKLSYYDFFQSKKPKAEIGYYSAYRQNFEKVLSLIKGGYENIGEKGFFVKRVEKLTPMEFQSIAILSREVFAPISWGYTELTKEELMELYTTDKLETHLNSVYILYKDEQIIGYCSVAREDNKTLICKTICIRSQYQGMGLGNAIAYSIHKDALLEGYQKIIYALIREENNVKHFPKDDAVIFRRYSAFEYTI